MFGGGSGRTFGVDGALWEWQDHGWTRVAQADAGRTEPGMCYDRSRETVVIFGGWDADREFSRTTFEWSGDHVIAVDSSGPSARAGHAFVYDPVRETCLLFGGRDADGHPTDTWSWDGSTWTRIATTGPSGRWFLGATTERSNERVVIFGGSSPDGDLADTWAWDGRIWNRIEAEGPPARSMAKLAFDGDGVVLFGGRAVKTGGFSDFNDTWILRGAIWTRLR